MFLTRPSNVEIVLVYQSILLFGKEDKHVFPKWHISIVFSFLLKLGDKNYTKKCNFVKTQHAHTQFNFYPNTYKISN